MDTSADVMVLSQPAANATSEEEGAEAELETLPQAPPQAPPPAASLDNLEEFSSRLSDIISAYGDAGVQKAELENTLGAKGDVAVETETSQIRESLDQFPSAQDKLDQLIQRHAHLAGLRRCDQQQLSVLQAESRRGAAARADLEVLCRDVQTHCRRLWEETVRRCSEEEERRTAMASHFQAKLTDIQAQIEQHSARNHKLCRENAHLTDKLELLVNQCQVRDESLEKISKHHELQLQLAEAKLQQANALLADAQDKHKREKEYLLLQAADGKLQAQTLRDQAAVMQAQLTLYGQKFDEFQGTLAKSNQIYARFKQEMDNMTEKMKKMEKETNVWKSRFENCNKALTDMMEERTEKGKEFQLFVLKIHKLEKLCRALQEERAVLYRKIKEVRQAAQAPPPGGPAPLTPTETLELQEEDPVLTEDMSRLREEQAKLQEFAASLLATPLQEDEDEEPQLDQEEDQVSSAFIQFKTRTRTVAESDSVPEQAESPPAEVKGQSPEEEAAQEPDPAGPNPEASSWPAQVLEEEDQREQEGATVAPPTEASPAASDPSRKQTSKKKKKKSSKNAS